jgi:putative CocE/NonD family hydrolase
MGPWYHGQWASGDGSRLGNINFGSATSLWYQNNIEIPFFNYHLKSKGTDSSIAEATIFFSGENKWKTFQRWPPADIKPAAIYLHANGDLSFNRPSGNNLFSEYISDPAHPVAYTEDVHFNRTPEYMIDDQRFASRRPDVLTFQTGVLTEDLTLAGPLDAALKVSISGTDADFVVKLIDVFPDDTSDNYDETAYPLGGYQMLVRGEIMRGKYRNNFSRPEAFLPLRITPVNFRLPDIAHTFKKGHRLMIQIQSSWFPLADRNPQQFLNIYEAKETDFKKATIRIHHDAANASAIMLPVFSK